MAVKVQHLRSSTASKRPTAAALLEGEVALNLSAGTTGAFFKDGDSNVIKIGPAEVGGSAPNSSPGAGGVSGNTTGEFWYDTSNSGGNGEDALKVFNGTSFVNVGSVTIGTTDVEIGSAGSTTLAGLTSFEADTVQVSAGPLEIQNANVARFYESSGNGTNYMALKAPASVTGNVVLTLPDGDGTANQVLQTDGAGQLSWGEARTNDVTDGDTSIVVDGTGDTITYEVGGTDYWVMDASGNFHPQTTTQSIGTNATRLNNLYVTNLVASSISGSWSGDIVGSDLGGLGADVSAAADGQILIANSNDGSDATFAAISATGGQSVTITATSSALTIDADFAAAAGTSAAGNAGVASFDSTQFSVDGHGFVTLDLVAVEDGGTGVDGSGAANGTVLIGNGTGYSLSTLTEGEGVDITNASGSITIAGEDATAGVGSANKGIASYESSDFTLTSGHVTLAGTVPQSVLTDGNAVTPASSQFTIAGGTGLTSSGAGSTLTLTLDDTSVTGGGYGSASAVPTYTVDAQGRLTAAANVTIDIAHTQVNDFDAGVQTNRLDQMAAPTASVDFNSQTITGLADPVNEQDAATKKYVDSTAQGLDTKASVLAASTAALTVTYDNGSSGVGATLTNAGAQAAFALDGDTLDAGDRVLIKDQASAAQNGIYTVTTVGDGSSNWVLTRAVDFDTAAEIPSGYTFVEGGNTQAGNGYVCVTEAGLTLGSTAITFEQFSGAGQIDAGAGLTKSGNTLNVGGTADNITVNADSVQIATTYVGQTSITTLGTVTTGTWNGSLVGTLYGGTGADGTNVTAGYALMAPNGAAGNVSYREILTSDIAPTTGGSFDAGSY